MSIRTISYTVTESGITPTTAQHGGVQGDHNATELEFTLPKTFIEKLQPPEGSTDALYYRYRFDGYSGSGLFKSTEPEPNELAFEDIPDDGITLTYPLEEWITRDGGNVQVLLVITAIKTTESGESTEFELYSFPALIKLKNRPRGKSYDGNSHESITTLAEVAKGAAESASSAAGAAGNSATQATISATNAQNALEELNNKLTNNFYKGDKGDKGDTGPQGEIGLQGPAGKDAVIDPTFDPTSENAQSGKAIAPVFANALKGYASGEKAVAVSDVSPIEHELGVNVTRTETTTLSTSVEEGKAFKQYDYIEFLEPITVQANSVINIQCRFELTNGTAPVMLYLLNANNASIGSAELGISIDATLNVTVYDTATIPNYELVKFIVVSSTSGTISYFNVSAEAKKEVSPKGVTISRYGKNLFDFNNVNNFFDDNGTQRNSYFKKEDNTLKSIIGYYSRYTYCNSNINILPAGKYTLSCSAMSEDAIIGFSIGFKTTNGDRITKTCRNTALKTWEKFSFNFQLEKETEIFGFLFQGGGNAENYTNINILFTNIQLELGAKATEYESYTKPTPATADAEGNVNELTSASPNMTLVSETEGVVINLEYNRDINKAFAELTQAIISMGGNV